MRKNFVTLFPSTYNVNLTKDVGYIPYILYRNFGYNSAIVSFKNDSYIYLNQYVKGIKMEFLKKGNERIACIKYILKNAKNIDILNMYHMSIGKSLLCFEDTRSLSISQRRRRSRRRTGNRRRQSR